WVLDDWGPCSASCDGGWQERKVYCAETSSDGTSTRVEETRCTKRKPKSKQHCNTEDCPKWHEGPWSGCSVSCGQGYQTRNVYCRDVRGHVSNICDQRTKPQMREQAAPIVQPYPPPQAQRYTGTHIVSSEPSFVPEAWGSCNVSCGEGYRRRKVDCKIFLEFSRTVAKLPDKECPGNKPAEIEHCTMKPCAMSQMDSSANYVEDHKNKISYSWRQTGFTPCSASCLGGVRESIIQCIRDNDQVLVSPYLCDISKKPDVLTQTCNDQPCPPRWNVSDFSPCSKPCGSGLQTRHVQCVHEVTRGGNTLVVPNGVCTQPPPRAQQFCNVFDCPPKWVPGPWTKCSKSCGGGTKTRKLQCEQVQALGQIVDRNPSHCSGARMATNKACNVKQCVPGRHNPSTASPRIYYIKQAYVQTVPRRRVSLKIGGRAILYRGTHLTVKCPVGKFNRSRIRWTKDQGLLTYSGRLKISKNGALRIRSLQAIDSGVYTCIAGRSRANITVIVKGPAAPKWIPPEPGMSIDRPPNVVDSHRPFSPKVKPFNKKPPFKPTEQDNSPSFSWLNKGKENHLPPEDKNSIETPIWDAVADQSAEKAVTEPGSDRSISLTKADLDKVTDMRVMPHIQQLLTNIKHTFSSNNGPRPVVVGSDDLDVEGLGDHAVASSFILGKGKAENLEFDWMVTDWSACSQSCGSGAYQVRASQCVVRLHNVSKTVDHSLCIDAGMQPPLTKQKCGMEECPHWEATEWSPCEVSRCAAVNMASQRRTVRCKLKNGTTIVDNTCNMKTKPRQRRQCYSDQCKGTWRTGEWSQCTVSCGELGFRSRIVQCVWVGTKKAAGNACRDTPRPSVVRPCRGPVCPKNKAPGERGKR
uniref:Ig-like domain-containing protein n=1 Tax=Strigamia maritima TaxID=126957 RepID=T1J768_STRMM